MIGRLLCRNYNRIALSRYFQANPQRSNFPSSRQIKPKENKFSSWLAGFRAKRKIIVEQGKKYGWSFIFLRLVVNCLSLLALLHYFINHVKLSESPAAKDLISKIVSEEKLDKFLKEGFNLGGVVIAGDAGVSFATANALFALLFVPRNAFALWAIAFLSRKIPDPKLAKGLRNALFINLVIVNVLLMKYIWNLLWEHANMKDVMSKKTVYDLIEKSRKQNLSKEKALEDLQNLIRNLLAIGYINEEHEKIMLEDFENSWEEDTSQIS